MTNFAWKPNYIDPNLLSVEFKKARKKIVWSRDSTVPESLIGQAVFIHNGKDFIKSYITREKVGFKFGDFAYTRRFTRKIDKKVKKKEQAKKKK